MEKRKVPAGKHEGEKKDVNVVREVKKDRGRVDGLSGTEAWSYMQKKHGFTGEQLVNMRLAMLAAVVEGRPATLVRIFDPAVAKEKGVTIEDYESLNKHPELIFYEGYYSGRGQTSVIVIEKRSGIGPSLLEKMTKEGTITEAAVKKDETTARKWLGRFGHFVMYGGFIVVIIVIVAIVLAIQTCTAPK